MWYNEIKFAYRATIYIYLPAGDLQNKEILNRKKEIKHKKHLQQL